MTHMASGLLKEDEQSKPEYLVFDGFTSHLGRCHLGRWASESAHWPWGAGHRGGKAGLGEQPLEEETSRAPRHTTPISQVPASPVVPGPVHS